MKTAEERARELWDLLPASAQIAIDLNYRYGHGKPAWVRDVALSFKEYACDQRRLCGVHVLADFNPHVVNAPFPGEG